MIMQQMALYKDFLNAIILFELQIMERAL